MSRRVYGQGPWRRLLSTLLVVAFTLSFSGIGYAAEAPTAEVPAAEAGASSPAEGAATEAPAAEEPAPAQEAAPAESEVAPPVTTAPDAPTARRAGATRERTAVKGATTRTGPAGTTAGASKPAGQKARREAIEAAVSAAAVTAQGSVSVRLEGYRLTPWAGWVPANLGKDYDEGDWVPYRFIIDNSGGDAPVSFGAFSFVYDHYLNTGGKNAVGFDATRGWKYYTTATEPDTGDPSSHSGTGLSPLSQDAGAMGSSPTLSTSFAAGSVVVPAGEYAVVMYEAHLAVTPWWRLQSPSRNGSGFYPGSSLQMRVASPSGDRTVTLPVPPEPDASIAGLKYNDLDHDGVRDAGEPGLGGWVFDLTGHFGAWSFTRQVTSAADGTFAFTVLPPGSYTLDEVAQAGWTNSTPLPMSFSLAQGEEKPIEVGNYHEDVTKRFSLSIDNAPAGASFYVLYTVNGGAPQHLDLTGSGPYTGSVDVPYGAVITTAWYASYAGEDLLLGTSGTETLYEDLTNRFAYDSSVSGHKFEDTDGQGDWDAGEPGLAGWAITLYRMGAAAPAIYAQTLTGAGGGYSFTDVLPGTYYVAETQQSGYFMTVGPQGDFAVAHGTAVDGLDFGNVPARAAIDVEKTGVALAHVGDVITYHIVVTNTGNATLYDVLVNDPLFGAPLGTIPQLAVGQSVEFWPTYTVPAGIDPVPNTVEAMGTDEFGDPAYDEDSWLVDVIHPAIRIDKTVEFDGDGIYGEDEMGYSGDTAAWRIVVTNTGDVELANVMVTDDHGASYGPMTLAAGASQQFDYAGPLTADRVNTAEATGIDPLEREVSARDSAEADVIAPLIGVVKTVDLDGDGVFNDSETGYAGQTATWKIVVTNVGDTDLANVVLDDSSSMTWPPFALPAGSGPVEFTYATLPDADTLNVATATGTDPLGNPVSDTDDASVDLIAPAIQIAKTVDFDGDGSYGELEQGYAASTAHWRVVVTNPGDVALYDVHVTDTNGQDHVIAELPAGGPGVTYEYDTVPGHDLVNEATATGYDRLEREYTASDTAAVDVIAPAISVAKTVDFDGDGVYGESEIGYAGNPAHWRIVVTNTGDVPLTDVDLGDSSSEDFPLFDLAAGASRTFDYSSTVFSDFTNLAEAVGIDPLGNPVTGSDTASVEPFTPGVTISKTVDFNGDGTFSESETYYTGSTAHWIVTVHNSGDVDLTNVVVTDLGHTWGPMTLPAGGPDAVFTYDTADVAADFTNIAGVLAYDPLGAELSAADSASVDVIDPGLAVVKSVDFDGDGTFSEAETSYLGDTAHWKIVVINTGDVTLTNVDVTDSNGESFHVDTLPAGQGNSVEFTYDRVPAGDTVNTVVVTALDPFEQELEATDEASVDTIAPALEIAKTVDYDGDGIYTDSELNFEGETAHWRIVVTNTGDVTLTDVDITDTNGQTHHVDTLPAFEGNSVEFTYDTVPTDDLVNVAIASATDPLQGGVGPVEDEAQVIVEPFLPFGEPDVAVDKSADKTEADPGELVNYTITYTNVSTNIAWNIVVTDDYDEDLATVVSAPGGTVSGGKIVWTDAGPLYAGESRSVHYQVRIASDLPVGTTYVDNVVVVKADDDYNPYNDTDNWRVRVRVSEGEEFLPFTGSEGVLALLLIAALALVGVSLRRLGRHEA